MNEWNIIGHDWAVQRLRQQIAGEQLAQSHLFVGPPSVGKSTLAKAFATAILSHHSANPVRARALAENLKHPDFTWVEPLETGFDRAEAIRDLLHALMLRPVEGNQRVAVINDAHIITERNSVILKTLEEPNSSSIIVLTAPSADSLLPTITSRCQVLNLRPVAAQVLKDALLQRGAEPGHADLLARLARGRPGWTLRALEDEDLMNERAQRLSDLESLLPANRTRRFEYAEALAKAGEETMQAVLDEWLLYWRDVARASGAAGPDDVTRDRLHHIDHAEAIVRLAGVVETYQAARMVRDITNTLKAIQQNASPRLALDALMLKMPVV